MRDRSRRWPLFAFATALAAALCAALSLGAAGEARRGLPRAELYVPHDVAAELLRGDAAEGVRVRILLRDQPVLVATQRRRFERAIYPRVPARVRARARRSAAGITRAEKRLAGRAERRYEGAVRGLADKAREAGRDQASVRRAIRRRGGRPIGSEAIPSMVVARVRRGVLRPLAGRGEVQAIERAPVERPQLDVATPATGAPSWWAAGHSGAEGANDTVPADVGITLGAPDATHPAFAGLTIDKDPREAISDHETHVAGIIASQHATYKGAAPGIDRLVASGSSAYLVGVTDPFDGQAGATDPAETINQSSGGTATSDNEDHPQDLIVEKFGVGYAAGAGNDGPNAGTVGNIGRNVLSVAALQDLNTVDPSDDIVASFSSRGPSPGGRKKPDLIAPGIGIRSPTERWNDTALPCGGSFEADGTCEDFTNFTGTSASTPFVAAAMALLEGAGIGDPKVQRAILTNSTRDWPGQTHWQPDVGWGALDLTEALAQRAFFATGSVEGGGVRFYRATVASGAKATLAWNMRGVWGSYPVCCLTAYTTTNLDLRQSRGSDLSEIPPPPDPGHGGGPDAVDPNDTTEQVRAPAGGTQEVIYKVKAASTVEGAEREPFAFAAEATLSELTAPEVEPTSRTLSAEGTVSCQTEVGVSTQLANGSPHLDAQDAKVSLGVPSDVELVSGVQTQDVSAGVLERQTTSDRHTWTVRATSSGTHELQITGQGGTMGETFARTERVSFIADCSPPQVRPTGTQVSPGGTVQCGTEVEVTTRARNDSHTDAEAAQVQLSPPPGAELVEGLRVQQVSGGVLEAQTTSEPHSWRVRLLEGAASAALTGSGETLGQTYAYPEGIMFSCERYAVGVELAKLRMRRGRIVVGGDVRPLRRGTPLSGEVEIEVRKGGKEKRRFAAFEEGGEFRTRVRVCREGRWRVSALHRASVGYGRGADSARIKARDEQLRC